LLDTERTILFFLSFPVIAFTQFLQRAVNNKRISYSKTILDKASTPTRHLLQVREDSSIRARMAVIRIRRGRAQVPRQVRKAISQGDDVNVDLCCGEPRGCGTFFENKVHDWSHVLLCDPSTRDHALIRTIRGDRPSR
jgi:hypothetical protein